jgi:hypothetical protein
MLEPQRSTQAPPSKDRGASPVKAPDAMTTQNLIIRTGSTFTRVTVDTERNQCSVQSMTGGAIYRGGTHEHAIRNVAMDGSGRSYRTIKALRADTDAECIRRRDLDC